VRQRIGCYVVSLPHDCSFRDGLIVAVNLGGDSVSLGTVYGQIAGTYYGLLSIPAKWREAVKDWKKVDEFMTDFLNAVKYV